jgi:hypothetical protein
MIEEGAAKNLMEKSFFAIFLLPLTPATTIHSFTKRETAKKQNELSKEYFSNKASQRVVKFY